VLFSQPALEQRLRAHLATVPGVEVRLGSALRRHVQDDTGVTAHLDDGSQVRASWLVGCDGARSSVRPPRARLARPRPAPLAGGRRRGGGAGRGRLHLPVRPVGPVGRHAAARRSPLGVAAARRRAGALARAAGRRARHALDRLPLRRPPRLVVASGRVLLAGDAAHTMPPFAGQGLGAGVRDAWALGELLPTGRVDRYEPLRAPHVRAMTRLSLLLGAVLETRSPPAAAVRDALLGRAFRAPGAGPWLSRGGPRSTASGVLDL
jgi:3-(3-hydroxy-phenyl)propionate hydroxylase